MGEGMLRSMGLSTSGTGRASSRLVRQAAALAGKLVSAAAAPEIVRDNQMV
jgi:hypothetical protein